MSAASDSNSFVGRNLSIGVDCEDVERWRRMLPQLENGPRHGLFTEGEHRYCRSFQDPSPHYAARWCAKEALLKALSSFAAIDVRRIEVRNHTDGRPYLVLNDHKLSVRAFDISLSLSHTRETAVAVVIVVATVKEGTVPKAEPSGPHSL